MKALLLVSAWPALALAFTSTHTSNIHRRKTKRGKATPSRTSRAPLFAIRDATFGMGCFWKPSEELLKTKGVIDTAVGYTGSPTPSKAPSYETVCFGQEWVEGVRVKYDDAEISYRELLDAFFEAQEPQPSRQYASMIFPHDEEQREEAQSWLKEGIQSKRVRERDGVAVAWTSIEPLSAFYQAEGYHQRYWQKQRPRFAFLLTMLTASSGLFDSIIPTGFASQLHSLANAVVLVACAGILLERKLDAKVFKLD